MKIKRKAPLQAKLTACYVGRERFNTRKDKRRKKGDPLAFEPVVLPIGPATQSLWLRTERRTERNEEDAEHVDRILRRSPLAAYSRDDLEALYFAIRSSDLDKTKPVEHRMIAEALHRVLLENGIDPEEVWAWEL